MTRYTAAIAAVGIALACGQVLPVGAAASALSGDDLKKMVAGKTVLMNTAMGGIPVVFRANGTMSGNAKTLAIYTGKENDTGRWWIASNKLCQQWQSWLAGSTHCVSVRLEGRTVHWRRDDGKTGTATLLSN